MKEIVASGTHEVTVTLTGPNADFPVVLGSLYQAVAQVQAFY